MQIKPQQLFDLIVFATNPNLASDLSEEVKELVIEIMQLNNTTYAKLVEIAEANLNQTIREAGIPLALRPFELTVIEGGKK
jgi:hypothetical protein